MIDVVMMLPTEEMFTHVDGEAQTHYAVSRLRAYCVAHDFPKYKIPVTKEHADYSIQNRGVEQHRLDRLTVEDLTHPILFVLLSDGSHLLVDGTHRYVRCYQLGVPECLAYIVEDQAVWEQFTVNAPRMSEDELTGWSGM